MKKPVAADPMLWLDQFGCGCTFVGTRGELLGYCSTHGDSRRNRPIPMGRASKNPNLKKGWAR